MGTVNAREDRSSSPSGIEGESNNSVQEEGMGAPDALMGQSPPHSPRASHSPLMFTPQRSRRKARERSEMEDWELEYRPHRITYQDIEAATKGFSEGNVIGIRGKVYKGVLIGGTEIAVKRISHENEIMRAFLAEIASLGRLKRRNLVGLRGWCKSEKGILLEKMNIDVFLHLFLLKLL